MQRNEASAGHGDTAKAMRENLYESLPPDDQERFLQALEVALESGLGEDAAWDRAWETVQASLPDENRDTEFALEDEAPES